MTAPPTPDTTENSTALAYPDELEEELLLDDDVEADWLLLELLDELDDDDFDDDDVTELDDDED